VTEHVITLQNFFEQARAGRLTGIRCGKCASLTLPPKELCPICHQRQWEPVPLAGTGVVTSFTVIRIPPRGRASEAPYAVVVVKLAEGVSVLGRMVDTPLDALKTGMPVKFRPLVGESQTMIGFAPA
jgi:uncharacterized protein